jgi:hypothetical protein
MRNQKKNQKSDLISLELCRATDTILSRDFLLLSLKWKTLRSRTLNKRIKCQQKLSLLNNLLIINLLLVSKVKMFR